MAQKDIWFIDRGLRLFDRWRDQRVWPIAAGIMVGANFVGGILALISQNGGIYLAFVFAGVDLVFFVYAFKWFLRFQRWFQHVIDQYHMMD